MIKQIECSKCHGEMFIPALPPKPSYLKMLCPECKGFGYVEIPSKNSKLLSNLYAFCYALFILCLTIAIIYSGYRLANS